MTRSAFFIPDGEAFIATEHTRGPWSEQHQHGGPGAALLAAAFERAAAPLSVARLTLEILRPIPIGRVLRVAEGGIGHGHAKAWLRMRIPLVLGRPTSPLSRVAIAADSGNGVSPRLDWRRWVFINPDLTIHLHRPPVGEWIGLESITETEPHGIGLAATVLHDEDGPIGRGMQSLYLDAAPG